MAIAKRVLLFLLTNILIMVTISIVMSVLGVQPYLQAKGIDYEQLLLFCLIWGFGGAFISLGISRLMAKWAMGVKVVDPQTTEPQLRWLVDTVHRAAQVGGLKKMPEVGVYESPDLNAFATGPTKNRALVAVSSGLLHRMSKDEIEGVLGHEIAHITNGDMVTMTLIQGVVNAFVMFIARIIAFAVSQTVNKDGARSTVYFLTMIGCEILMGILGSMLVAYFSRIREFRADRGGALFTSREKMIHALEALKQNFQIPEQKEAPSLATLKISGRGSGLMKFFSTHPPLEVRIQRLKDMP